jgi:hypothetical protein
MPISGPLLDGPRGELGECDPIQEGSDRSDEDDYDRKTP